ncbi:MAG: folylpolyglutamate synthase/dihydrofolate synthase family protein [Bacteroidales bacterium]|nr:folylpolyglutamate synthase/dihydrofolate synthase family protein [Bacteroidales bacterium]
MTYLETLDYLFNAAPMFQHVGASAYKEGLSNTHLLDAHFGHPHRNYRTIHVGGTNGKGSTSHSLAAVLQAAGYRVGLYTSPHLVDFRERIRVNGAPISQQRVIDFVEQERHFFEPLSPSFFELTTALAFLYFAEEKVDVAIVEVGLGGRLDCTNIIQPILSIITNISLDHTQFLGTTLAEIAREKAGIIKSEIPVVIGAMHEETRPIFEAVATERSAPLYFSERFELCSRPEGGFTIHSSLYGKLYFELSGRYQQENICTILTAIEKLTDFDIRPEHVREGLANVCKKTGLQGRWQILRENPLVVCDTGHNLAAWQDLAPQLEQLNCQQLHLIFGASADKDVRHILQLLPQKAKLYFTQASVQRALPLTQLMEQAESLGLKAQPYPTVKEAYAAARSAAHQDDALFIGGSSFIVADFLAQAPTH